MINIFGGAYNQADPVRQDATEPPAKFREPSMAFIEELARALTEAEHRNVAEHLAAGLLWSMYPEWFSKVLKPSSPYRLSDD